MTGWQAALVAAICVAAMGWPTGSSAQRLELSSTVLSATDVRRRGRRTVIVATTVVPASLFVVCGVRPQVALVGMVALAATVATRRIIAMGRDRGVRRSRQRRVVDLCDALSAELRAGLPMITAVRRCCRDDAELASVVHVAELGGDVGGAFRRCAGLPGADGLRAVAAAWDVAGSTGSALSQVLDRMAAGLRADEEARAEVEAALGPPRATARLLAGLPVFGLALGSSIGAHPVHFLLATSAGLTCLCVGSALALLGLWWVERLAAAAEV